MPTVLACSHKVRGLFLIGVALVLIRGAMPQKLLQDTTNAGAPSWASPTIIPTSQGSATPGTAYGYTDVANANKNGINVVNPSLYTKPIAAHEATHIFQNSRNGDFQRASDTLLPSGPLTTAAYDYGGVKGLQANPQKTIANYNPEQQAEMVEDLTAAQANLKPHMSVPQLQQWDDTKNVLERPVRQLMAVPPQDKSLAGRADEWLATRADPQFSSLDHPFTRLKGLFSQPTMNLAPQPAPDAPSVALGYANPSKLVR